MVEELLSVQSCTPAAVRFCKACNLWGTASLISMLYVTLDEKLQLNAKLLTFLPIMR